MYGRVPRLSVCLSQGQQQRRLVDLLLSAARAGDIDIYSALVVCYMQCEGWLGSRVVSVLDSGAEGPGFKSQSRRCRVLGKLLTLIVPLFTKQQNW